VLNWLPPYLPVWKEFKSHNQQHYNCTWEWFRQQWHGISWSWTTSSQSSWQKEVNIHEAVWVQAWRNWASKLIILYVPENRNLIAL
jgi:hypothetical protein